MICNIPVVYREQLGQLLILIYVEFVFSDFLHFLNLFSFSFSVKSFKFITLVLLIVLELYIIINPNPFVFHLNEKFAENKRLSECDLFFCVHLKINRVVTVSLSSHL